MRNRKRQSRRGVEFGGLSFRPHHQPFASATGKDEMPMDDDIVKETPWWLAGLGGLIGGLKLYKQCICVRPNGSEVTIDDCPRLQKCPKCCAGRVGENFTGGYDPFAASSTK